MTRHEIAQPAEPIGFRFSYDTASGEFSVAFYRAPQHRLYRMPSHQVRESSFQGIKRTFQDRLPDSKSRFLLFDEAAKSNRKTNTRVRTVE